MSGYHAKLSPSSAHRWTSCTASPDAQDGIPSVSSDASRHGTTCHLIQEELLLNPERDPQSYLGRVLLFWSDTESDDHGEGWSDELTGPYFGELRIDAKVAVTQDMINAVMTNVAYVRELVALHGGRMLVEQKLPIGHFTGEDGATGSGDVLIVLDDRIIVIDAKFGHHKVHAYEQDGEIVRPNLQMACYALGALKLHDEFGLVDTVSMVILQPFVNHISEYSCSVGDLMATQKWLSEKAEETRTNRKFVASFDNCHFCRAKGQCQAQTELVLSTALDGFEDVDSATPKDVAGNALGSLYARLPMIRDWCDHIENLTRTKLDNGERVERNDGIAYKLVEGKMGSRKWANAADAEAALKTSRLKIDQMYELKLISPTAAEALSKVPKGSEEKPVIGPRQWKKIQTLITQDRNKPSIVLETDPRPAITKAAGFEDVAIEDTPSELSDLF